MEEELGLALTVTSEEGAEQEAVTAAIEESVRAYLAALALEAYTPKVGGPYGYTVSYARLGAAILDAPGVADYQSLTVNGGTANVAVPGKSAAVLGEVSVTYADGT